MTVADLARSAARAAARIRADLGVGPAEGVCPFDLAEGLEVPVRLVALPSLEGMYSPEPRPTIILSVQRPPGRQRFTCAHEIGHHVFEHGTRIDELDDAAAESWSPEEFVAQRFAAALLMPKLAVESAFAKRGWPIADPDPEAVFAVAQELGVGYTTLIGHLERTLGRLPSGAADGLRRLRLPQLRNRLAGFDVDHDAFVVDQHWGRRTIDVHVGDVVLLPTTAEVEGRCASTVERPIRHLLAVETGVGTVSVSSDGSPLPLRVCRREFTGLARYRHLEEVSDDE